MNKDLDQHKVHMHDHLIKCDGDHSWFYSVEAETYRVRYERKEACYAGFRPVERHLLLGLGYFCPKEGPQGQVGEAWLNFILDKEKSPWRSAFKDDFELIEDKNNIRGISIGPKTLESIPTKFLMNFCIASRHYNEFYEHIAAWFRMVQEGIDPYRAYYHAGNLTSYDGEGYLRNSQVHNSNHWTLCGNVHMKNLVGSSPNLEHGNINCIFSKESSTYVMYPSRYAKYLDVDHFIKFDKIKEMDAGLTL